MNKPEKTFRAGGVAATIWANDGTDKQGNEIKYFTVSIERSYKKDEEWKKTNSFRSQDLPKVELVSRKAFEFLNLKEDYSKAEKEEPKKLSEEEVV